MDEVKTSSYGFEILYQIHLHSSVTKLAVTNNDNSHSGAQSKSKSENVITFVVSPLTTASSSLLYILQKDAGNVSVWRRNNLVKRIPATGVYWEDCRHCIFLNRFRIIATTTGTRLLNIFDDQLNLLHSVKLKIMPLTLTCTTDCSELIIGTMGAILFWPVIKSKSDLKVRLSKEPQVKLADEPRLTIRGFQLGEWPSLLVPVKSSDLIYAAVDNNVYAFRMSTGENVTQKHGFPVVSDLPVSSLVYDFFSKFLLVGTVEGRISVYNNQKLKVLTVAHRNKLISSLANTDFENGYPYAVVSLMLTPNTFFPKASGDFIALFADGTLTRFSLLTDKAIQHVDIPEDCKLPSKLLHLEDNLFAIACSNSGPAMVEWHCSFFNVDHVHISIGSMDSSDALLLASSNFGFFQIFNISSFAHHTTCLLVPPKRELICKDQIYLPNEKLMAVLTQDSTLVIWDTKTNPGVLLADLYSGMHGSLLKTIANLNLHNGDNLAFLGGLDDGQLVLVTANKKDTTYSCSVLGQVLNGPIEKIYVAERDDSCAIIVVQTAAFLFRVWKISFRKDTAEKTLGFDYLSVKIDRCLGSFEIAPNLGTPLLETIKFSKSKMALATTFRQVVILEFSFSLSSNGPPDDGTELYRTISAKDEDLHTQVITCMCYFSEQNLLVTGSKDLTVRIWENGFNEIILLAEIQIPQTPTAIVLSKYGYCHVAFEQGLVAIPLSLVLSKRQLDRFELKGQELAKDTNSEPVSFDSNIDVWSIYDDENKAADINPKVLSPSVQETSMFKPEAVYTLAELPLVPSIPASVNLRKHNNPRLLKLKALCIDSPSSSMDNLDQADDASGDKSATKALKSISILQTRRLLRSVHLQIYSGMQNRQNAAPKATIKEENTEQDAHDLSQSDDLKIIEKLTSHLNILDEQSYLAASPKEANSGSSLEIPSSIEFVNSINVILKALQSSEDKFTMIPGELKSKLNFLIKQRDDAIAKNRRVSLGTGDIQGISTRKLRKPLAMQLFSEPLRLEREKRRQIFISKSKKQDTIPETYSVSQSSGNPASEFTEDGLKTAAKIDEPPVKHCKPFAKTAAVTVSNRPLARRESTAVGSVQSTEKFKKFLQERRNIHISKENAAPLAADVSKNHPTLKSTASAHSLQRGSNHSLHRGSVSNIKASAALSRNASHTSLRASINTIHNATISSSNDVSSTSKQSTSILDLLQLSDSDSDFNAEEDAKLDTITAIAEEHIESDSVTGKSDSILDEVVLEPEAAHETKPAATRITAIKVQVKAENVSSTPPLLEAAVQAPKTPVVKIGKVITGMNKNPKSKIVLKPKPNLSQHVATTVDPQKPLSKTQAPAVSPENATPSNASLDNNSTAKTVDIPETSVASGPIKAQISKEIASKASFNKQTSVVPKLKTGAGASEIKPVRPPLIAKTRQAVESTKATPAQSMDSSKKIPIIVAEPEAMTCDVENSGSKSSLRAGTNVARDVASYPIIKSDDNSSAKNLSLQNSSDTEREESNGAQDMYPFEYHLAGNTTSSTKDLSQNLFDADEISSIKSRKSLKASLQSLSSNSARLSAIESNAFEDEELDEFCEQIEQAEGDSEFSHEELEAQDTMNANETQESKMELADAYVDIVDSQLAPRTALWEIMEQLQNYNQSLQLPEYIEIDEENMVDVFSLLVSILLEHIVHDNDDSCAREQESCQKHDENAIAEELEDAPFNTDANVQELPEYEDQELDPKNEEGVFSIDKKLVSIQDRCFAMERLFQLVDAGKELLDVEGLTQLIKPQIDCFNDADWEVRVCACEILPHYVEILLKTLQQTTEVLDSILDLEIEICLYKLLGDPVPAVRKAALFMVSKYFAINSTNSLQKRMKELGFLTNFYKRGMGDTSTSFNFYKTSSGIIEMNEIKRTSRASENVKRWLFSSESPQNIQNDLEMYSL